MTDPRKGQPRSRRRPKWRALAIGLALLLTSTAVAGAAVPFGFAPLRQVPADSAHARYVSPGGSDRNPGTRARPWRTIDRALRSAVPGRTILLRAGTYSEAVTAARGGSAAAPVTIRAYPRERVVLTSMLTIEASWIRVSGIRFTGGSTSSDDVLLYVSGGDHVEISGNVMSGSPSSAIYIGDGGDLAADVRILGNRVRENGDDDQFDHGIYCGHARGVVIANNIVAHNRAFGIQMYPDCDDAIVTSNTIVANGRTGVVVGGDGEAASDRDRVVNNIIARNRGGGVLGFWEGPIGGSNRVVRNLFFRNGGPAVGGEALASSRNVAANPRFANERAGNYALRARSPAIGRAIVALAPARDLSGKARGARRDLGALEAAPGR